MNKKEQKQFNEAISDLLFDIIWDMNKINKGESIKVSDTEILWKKIASIKGLLQP